MELSSKERRGIVMDMGKQSPREAPDMMGEKEGMDDEEHELSTSFKGLKEAFGADDHEAFKMHLDSIMAHKGKNPEEGEDGEVEGDEEDEYTE